MRRTQLFQLVPWVGGVNTSTDPGLLNPQELQVADNVVFTTTGARINREALEYFDHDIPAPDFRSSSGTTRTLKWTTNSLVNISVPDERLVAGEKITVTGNTNYAATATPILSRTEVAQVTTVQCVADVSGSLAGTYFLLSAGDSGIDYYVWYKVSGTGTDPTVAGRTGVEVDISTDDVADDVASATQTVLNALAAFGAAVSTDTVTVTNAVGGLTSDGSAGTSGFIVTITTKGGHEITYEASSSLSESSTAAGGITISRASSIISFTDYWRWDGTENVQLGVAATDDFQLFRYDDSGRRVQVQGQGQVTTVTANGASTLTGGEYFFLWSANDATKYAVWYKVGGAGSDPAIANTTSVEVDVGATDTADQVATATASAIDALVPFSASALSSVVTITNESAGITTNASDHNTGFAVATATPGATLPAGTLRTIRTMVMNERLLMFFSGLGNLPIAYNPDEDPMYQLLATNAPDASFGFEWYSRVWANQKDNRDRMNYSAPFDETTWGGIGDSGALDIGVGDGDPQGITNGYKYQDFIVVSKKSNRYRVTGDSPENYYPQLVSAGLGNEGAFSIPVDESDVVFASRRGFHSQAATDAYGDTASKYLSSKIKPTYVSFNPARLDLMQGAFVPELNSVAMSVSEQGHTSQNAVWLYNIEVQLPNGERGAWYRWPDVSCQALSRRLSSGVNRLMFGTNDGRLIQAQVPDEFADFGTDGIAYEVKSGALYPDGNPQTMKIFKKITLFYRPRGSFSFTVKAKIDNFASQSFQFEADSGADLLGSTFILGQSQLGSTTVLAPFTFSMDGRGRGIMLDILHSSPDQQIEIWGVGIEYESADVVQETV